MSRFGPLLRHRDFRAVWAAAVVSGFGDRVATIAMYLLIYKMTGRAVNLGLLVAAQIVPAIVLGPLSGLVLDRYNRKNLMVMSDLLGALVAATLPLAATPGQVYILAAMLSAGRQFTGPARLALMPDILPGDQLSGANSLLMITRNLVLMVGPAFGGALVAWHSSDVAFWVDAGTFLLSAAFLVSRRFTYLASATPANPPAENAAAALVETPVAEPALAAAPTAERASAGSTGKRPLARIRSLVSEAHVGLQVVMASPELRFAFAFFASLTFVTAMQQPLVVVFVKETLRSGDISLGLIVSAAGMGGILGAVLGGARLGDGRPLRTVVVLTAIDGCLLVVFALNRSVWLAAALFAVFGAIGTLAQIALATFLQRETPEANRGRTFGWLGTCVGPLSLVSVFLGPFASEVLGVVAVLVISGAFEIVVAVVGGLLLRRRQRGLEIADPARGS